jgi:hypothetical protein
MNLPQLKTELFQKYHSSLSDPVKAIAARSESHQNKAKQVNKLISDMQDVLARQMTISGNQQEKQQALLVIQYCTSVISLEYRHMVWPYEYMALSRRVGELWERFCRAAWDQPSRQNVERMEAPSFASVGDALRNRLEGSLKEESKNSALPDIETLFQLVGEINMKEDEMFTLDGTPHIIDFKSGFGSNEKGNTLRLQTVGHAYKLWNPETRLLLLVRQEQNNNYLNVIKRSGLWDVRCGDAAYAAIDELTGSNVQALRSQVIDFQSDLSDAFWNDLSSHLSDLTSYLQW